MGMKLVRLFAAIGSTGAMAASAIPAGTESGDVECSTIAMGRMSISG